MHRCVFISHYQFPSVELYMEDLVYVGYIVFQYNTYSMSMYVNNV